MQLRGGSGRKGSKGIGEGRKPHSHRSPLAFLASDNIHSVALAARWNGPKSMRPIALERHKAVSRPPDRASITRPSTADVPPHLTHPPHP